MLIVLVCSNTQWYNQRIRTGFHSLSFSNKPSFISPWQVTAGELEFTSHYFLSSIAICMQNINSFVHYLVFTETEKEYTGNYHHSKVSAQGWYMYRW